MNTYNSFLKKTLPLFIILLTLNSTAQNWTGNVNSDWNNSANWTGWPLTGDDILIDPANYTGAAASPVISANSVFTPAGMIVQNGATLTVNANLTTTKRIELFANSTWMIINGGTVFASGGGSQGRFIVSDGAQVLQNGGTAKANQRMIIELGGKYTLNSGTVNPLLELAIGDGNAFGSSLFDMNGGSVITGDIGFENEAGLYYPMFDMSGGTLSLSGGIAWLGVAPGAGTPRFIMSGGTATIGGDITNDPATTVDLYMNVSGNANLSFNGALITLINPTDSIKQSGTSLFTLANTNTFGNPGVFSATGGTTTFSGNTSLQGSGSYQFHNMIINSAKTLSHISPASISVAGDFTNNGTFNANLNTVIFSGNSAQAIQGNSLSTFRNITLNNLSAPGITLNKSITVTGALQLLNGKLNSSALNIITLTDNATSGSGSPASFINGPLKKVGNDAFVFPVGKNNRWRRLAMTAPASVLSEFTGEYFDNSYINITPFNMPLTAVTNIEYWKLNRANSTDAVNTTLYWEDAFASAITNCAQLTTAYWNGSVWNNIPSTTTGICTGNGAGSIQSGTALNNFGIFTFGFFGIVTPQNFTICYGDSISVGPNTYTSSGTYIDILTAVNLTDSTVITQLNVLPAIIKNHTVSVCYGGTFSVGLNTYSLSGNYSDTLVSAFGCDSIVNTALTIKSPVNVSVTQNGVILMSGSNLATNYQWIDCSNNNLPLIGEVAQSFTASVNGNYAVMVTESNCSDTSACFAVTSVGIQDYYYENNFSVYPNPGNGIITIKFYQASQAQFKLMDLTGRIILEKELNELSTQVNYQEQPGGIYFAEITQNDQVKRIKLIKN